MAIKKTRLYISLVLEFLLIITGSISTSAKYIKVQRIGILLAMFSYISAFHSVIWSMVHSSNITVISESLSILMILVSSFAMVCIVQLRKHFFIRVIKCIDAEPENVIKEIHEQFFKILKMVTMLIIVIETLYFITGITTSSSNDVKMGSPESLYMSGYIPWDYDTPLKYSLSVVYQFLMLLYPFIINYSTFAVLSGFYVYINYKFAQLLALVDNMRNCVNLITQDGSKNKYHHDLIQVIKCYQQWKSLANEFALYVGHYCSAVLFCVILCSVWSMDMVTETEIPILVKVKNISLLLYTIAQLTMICLLGEYFQKKDNEIKNAMYNTLWYESFNQSRKIIIGFMLLTQRATQVRAYGMILVNANLILHVLRIIYSVLNLYREAYTKRSII